MGAYTADELFQFAPDPDPTDSLSPPHQICSWTLNSGRQQIDPLVEFRVLEYMSVHSISQPWLHNK